MGKVADALEKAGFGDGGGKQDGRLNRQIRPERPDEPLPRETGKPEPPPQLVGSGLWDERLLKVTNGDGRVSEIFKTLRSRVLHPQQDKPVPKSIMVTSALPTEGKSFISANLGVSLAQGVDQYSLLVDCDLRRPSLAAMFGMNNNVGLVDYLRGHDELSDFIHKTSVSKLSILASGKVPDNPAELLGSARMSALVNELSSRYEDRFIIFDSPPVQVASEAIVLAGQVDAVILVVRQGGAGKAQVEKLIELIGADRILGIVFNVHTTNILENALMKNYGYYQGYS